MESKKEFLKKVDESLKSMNEFLSEERSFEEISQEILRIGNQFQMDKPVPPKELIDEYQGYVDQLLCIETEYQGKYEQLERVVKEQVVRTEYASGGEIMHRGFYCPSLCIERIVGGISRGKLIKQPRSNSKNYYIYKFNDHNQLLSCDQFLDGRCNKKEFLIYKQNFVYGISYEYEQKDIVLLSMEQYNEMKHLQHYLTFQPDHYNGHHRIIASEKYEYDEIGQPKRDIVLLEGIISMSFLREESYELQS